MMLKDLVGKKVYVQPGNVPGAHQPKIACALLDYGDKGIFVKDKDAPHVTFIPYENLDFIQILMEELPPDEKRNIQVIVDNTFPTSLEDIGKLSCDD